MLAKKKANDREDPLFSWGGWEPRLTNDAYREEPKQNDKPLTVWERANFVDHYNGPWREYRVWSNIMPNAYEDYMATMKRLMYEWGRQGGKMLSSAYAMQAAASSLGKNITAAFGKPTSTMNNDVSTNIRRYGEDGVTVNALRSIAQSVIKPLPVNINISAEDNDFVRILCNKVIFEDVEVGDLIILNDGAFQLIEIGAWVSDEVQEARNYFCLFKGKVSPYRYDEEINAKKRVEVNINKVETRYWKTNAEVKEDYNDLTFQLNEDFYGNKTPIEGFMVATQMMLYRGEFWKLVIECDPNIGMKMYNCEVFVFQGFVFRCTEMKYEDGKCTVTIMHMPNRMPEPDMTVISVADEDFAILEQSGFSARLQTEVDAMKESAKVAVSPKVIARARDTLIDIKRGDALYDSGGNLLGIATRDTLAGINDSITAKAINEQGKLGNDVIFMGKEVSNMRRAKPSIYTPGTIVTDVGMGMVVELPVIEETVPREVKRRGLSLTDE